MTCELTPRSRPGFAPDRVDDRYRLIRVLGDTGPIWLAEDEVLWRRVAIQRVEAGMSLADALARLHAVKIFNVVEWDGRSWIVMEATIGIARPVGPRAEPPRTNTLGWRGRAKVPAPTSRNGFDR